MCIRSKEMLLVEDNPVDVRIIEEGLTLIELKLDCALSVLKDQWEKLRLPDSRDARIPAELYSIND